MMLHLIHNKISRPIYSGFADFAITHYAYSLITVTFFEAYMFSDLINNYNVNFLTITVSLLYTALIGFIYDLIVH